MKKLLMIGLFTATALLCFAGGGVDESAGEGAGEGAAVPEFNQDLNFAQIVKVSARLEASGNWTFSVTVRHNDEGWEHYADLWEVIDPETSVVFGRRVLAHPHDNEQPFTRSQSGIVIPEETTVVQVRAKCTQHGFDGKGVLVDLTKPEGDSFTVTR